MKEKCSLSAGLYFFSSPPFNLTIFCGNDSVLLCFTVTNKNADTFVPLAILFHCYFFVTFIVFNKKIVHD